MSERTKRKRSIVADVGVVVVAVVVDDISEGVYPESRIQQQTQQQRADRVFTSRALLGLCVPGARKTDVCMHVPTIKHKQRHQLSE